MSSSFRGAYASGSSDSGKRTSGVRRLIGGSPSMPLSVSTSTTLPADIPWCGPAIAITFVDFGTGRASHVPHGFHVLLP